MVPNGDLQQINEKLTRLLTHDKEQDRNISRLMTTIDRHLRECSAEKEKLQKEVTVVGTKLNVVLGIQTPLVLAIAAGLIKYLFF